MALRQNVLFTSATPCHTHQDAPMHPPPLATYERLVGKLPGGGAKEDRPSRHSP
jgi:hypothetical protein